MEGVKCNEVPGAVYAFPRITIPKRAIEEAKVPVPPPLPQFWTSAYEAIRPSKKKVSRPDFCKKESGQPVFLFIISYCMLSLHIITFPQGYVGALRSNINKTKHLILIKHKFV